MPQGIVEEEAAGLSLGLYPKGSEKPLYFTRGE